MKKSILFSIAIVTISVFSAASVKAQSKGMTQSSDAFGVGTNVISAGIGLGSTIADYTYGTQSPGFNVTYDRGFWEAGPGVISLGGYAGIKDYKYGYVSNGYAYSEKWDYTVVGVRAAWHFTGLDIDNLDLYGGLMLAYYALSYSYSDNQGNSGGSLGNYGNTVGVSVFAGARYYFAGNLGAFGELGFGANVLSLGVSYKF
jgi:hypothetical protein